MGSTKTRYQKLFLISNAWLRYFSLGPGRSIGELLSPLSLPLLSSYNPLKDVHLLFSPLTRDSIIQKWTQLIDLTFYQFMYFVAHFL